MGVKGLWNLITPTGRRISIETLSGKRLAIDASIWLTQFLKAMRDPETGQSHRAAHLIGFFRRICKLQFHKIRPVFVFDGATPEIKRAEVLRRKRKRDEFSERTTDATFKRLAKKLVTDMVQKQRLSKVPQGGAFAAGFNPGRQRDDTLANSDDEEVKFVGMKNAQQGETSMEDLVGATGEPDKSQQEISDWDLPEAKEAEQQVYGEESGFAIEHVSSLPAVQRKDAIEKARRAQRLQSRREFMPAAANPQSFSNVQMKNFLKHCKLNRDIVKMAEQAAKQENDGRTGDLMASDRTTRVELIREDDTDGPKSLLAERLKAKKQAKTTKTSHFTHVDSSDDDDDVDWGERKEPAADFGTKGKRRVVDDDDSSSDEGTPGGFLRPHEKDSHESVNDKERNLSIIHLDEDKEGNAGGFIRALEGDAADANAKKSKGPELLVINSSDEDSIDNGEAGGGFLKDDNVKNRFVSDAAVAQEMEDRDLALALQNEEYMATVRNDRDVLQATTTTKPVPRSTGVFEENAQEGSGDIKSSIADAQVPGNDECVSESSEEDVAWEDGEGSNCEESDSPSDGVAFEKTTPDEDWATKDAASPLVEKNLEPEAKGSVSLNRSLLLPEKRNKVDDSTDNDPMSPETSAALLQAEKTASNLTNWAGRAFRRAVREAGAPEKSSEHDEIQQNQENLPGPSQMSTGAVVEANVRQMEPVEAGVSHQKSPHFGGAGRQELNKPVDWSFLNDSGADLLADAKRRERDNDTITDEMLLEAKQLLRLFGIPYVEAPAEAEAQCATLEQLGLVDGIVTEDSDVFAFGGQHVYKNIFDEQQYTEAYFSSDAKKKMNLGRNGMVALAMLLGSDYTEGVKGVGPVNAMEVLSAFDVSEDLNEGLSAFREWLDGFDISEIINSETSKKEANEGALTKKENFHRTHKKQRTKWIAPQNFPSQEVMKAYLDPVVDTSTQRFSWGEPDYERLTLFCCQNIGWPPDHVRRLLEPVIEARNTSLRQTRIDSYMKFEDEIRFVDIRSKRLNKVLEGINKGSPRDG